MSSITRRVESAETSGNRAGFIIRISMKSSRWTRFERPARRNSDFQAANWRCSPPPADQSHGPDEASWAWARRTQANSSTSRLPSAHASAASAASGNRSDQSRGRPMWVTFQPVTLATSSARRTSDRSSSRTLHRNGTSARSRRMFSRRVSNPPVRSDQSGVSAVGAQARTVAVATSTRWSTALASGKAVTARSGSGRQYLPRSIRSCPTRTNVPGSSLSIPSHCMRHPIWLPVRRNVSRPIGSGLAPRCFARANAEVDA